MMTMPIVQGWRGGRGLICTVVWACLLAACATPPATRLFVLGQPASSHQAGALMGASSKRPVLVVAPVALADVLRHGGIVYQTGVHQVTIAQHNRWAAPLGRQLTRRLRTSLQGNLPDIDVHSSGRAGADYRLIVFIDRFQGRYGGKAIVSGHWRLRRDQKRIKRGRFVRVVTLHKAGYPALVDALGSAWHAVAQTLAQAIEPAVHPAGA